MPPAVDTFIATNGPQGDKIRKLRESKDREETALYKRTRKSPPPIFTDLCSGNTGTIADHRARQDMNKAFYLVENDTGPTSPISVTQQSMEDDDYVVVTQPPLSYDDDDDENMIWF